MLLLLDVNLCPIYLQSHAFVLQYVGDKERIAMIQQKPYDECYFTNYDSYRDLCIYEIGKQACSPSYSYGPSIRHHYIFHYLLTGQGRLRLGDQEYTVHAHEGFIIPPNTLSYYVADSDNPWDYIWIHLDGSKIPELFQDIGLNDRNPVFIPSVYPNPLDSIMQEFLLNQNRELYCIGKAYELFDCLTQYSVHRQEAQADLKLSYIRKIIDLIYIKYSEPLHMDDIAHICGLNRSYMTKLFKRATGHTPSEYLHSYRMKQARKLLKNSDLSVQAIAYSVGYSDTFTFSKAFKRATGYAPLNYRQKMSD